MYIFYSKKERLFCTIYRTCFKVFTETWLQFTEPILQYLQKICLAIFTETCFAKFTENCFAMFGKTNFQIFKNLDQDPDLDSSRSLDPDLVSLDPKH